ncbi:hypothetical protein BHM03_00047083 [Ensete ventricosum]|nr:hypothetical protein BHM03_00047083 [Ensete ventricosum]
MRHPLRFPNSGIRAKVFVRKIGFKLRVMRLNRIELFYAFLLRFHSKGNEEEGQQGMARPHARGWPAAAKAPLQWGGRLRPSPPQGQQPARGDHPEGQHPPASTTGCANDQAARGNIRKGLPPATRPQGAAARDAPARGSR